MRGGDGRDVFNAINNEGDIGAGLTLLAGDGAGGTLFTGTLGQVYAGTYLVKVDAIPGPDAAAEQAAIEDAIASYNDALATYGVVLAELPDGVAATPDIEIHFADTMPIGGAADGVLDVTMTGGQIILVKGWNGYTGSDPSQLGADQYDFETIAAHELGHSIGLGTAPIRTRSCTRTWRRGRCGAS